MINHPLILFDGTCNLCNSVVDFIIKRQPRASFRFVTLQSDTGKKLIEKYNIPSEIDSVILLIDNKIYAESEAAVEIARLLPFPWNIAVGFKVIPWGLRNKIYRWIAKNRYSWFGKEVSCRLPTPEEKILFPEASDLNL